MTTTGAPALGGVPNAPATPLPPPRQMHGPSALGGGARRFLHLTWMLATTDFKLTFFGSVLGYVWSLLRPLMLFGVLYVVFTYVFKLGANIPNYSLVLLFDIVLFGFFQEATGAAVPSVVQRENIVRKMHFPRLVIPLATVCTATFTLLLNLIVVAAFMVALGVEPRVEWLLMPLIIVPYLLLSIGTALILSSLYVRFRDIAPIWSVASQTLFYGSCVLYTIQIVPPSARRYLMLNPLAGLLTQARHWLMGPSCSVPPNANIEAAKSCAPTVHQVTGSWLVPGISALIVVAVCVFGFWLFNREAPRIAEEL